MQVAQVVERLHELADARAVAIWAKMYTSPEPYLGVNLTKLKALAKEIKKNHGLALELWDSGIHDAKLLATMIEEPKKVDAEQVERQMTQVYACDVMDKYCTNVVAKTSFILPNIVAWTQHTSEMYQRGGYTLLATLARSETLTEDSFFTPYLRRIEAEIGHERNWVREAMNYALIAIGQRTAMLHQVATTIAERIGPITIDYGATSCKAPDALANLRDPTSDRTMGGLGVGTSVSSHNVNLFEGRSNRMVDELNVGDHVAWNTAQGQTTGTIKRKLTSPTDIKGHHVAASEDEPQYLVASDATGKEAAHKTDALRKIED